MRQLEYGKWYSCADIMPEDFAELIEMESPQKTAQVIVKCEDPYLRPFNWLGCRIEVKDRYEWFGGTISRYIATHWMAIPPIKIEF